MQLKVLRHRIDLLITRLENATNIGNSHIRDNHVYLLRKSMDALENGKSLVWSMGSSNIRLVADIDGLQELADRADKYLERLAKKGGI